MLALPPTMAEDAVLSVRGKRLAARWLTPEGASPHAPTVIFLHEALGSIGQWKGFPAALCAATGLRGLIYDRQGYGGSDPLEAERSPDYLRQEGEEWLPAVVEAAGLTTVPPVLFGHSDGGSIALFYAAAQPTAALITEAAHIYIEEITLEGIRAFGRRWGQSDLPARLARYHGDKTETVFRAWHDTWQRPEFRAFSMVDVLPRIPCPALILQGEEDEYGSPAQVHDIVAGLGPDRATPWFLPGCGHIPHLEQGAAVVEGTAAFLKRVLGAGA